MWIVLVTSLVTAPLSPAARLVDDPTLVRSVVEGANAVGLDPAAPVVSRGVELEGQARFTNKESGGTRWGLATSLPLGNWAFYGGYSWLTLPDTRVQRLTLGTAAWLTRRLALGVSYRYFKGDAASSPRANVWDLGLLFRPNGWMSVSLGIDAVNQPSFDGTQIERAARIGGALRPWMGAEWLTLAGETRIDRREGKLDLLQTRLLLDVMPLTGLHLRAAYLPGRDELWAGVALNVLGSELRGSAAAAGESLGASGANLSLTLRQHPVESVVEVSGRTTRVVLQGDLIEKPGSILGSTNMISDAVLRLDRLADDESVDTVVLAISDLDVSLATVEELRAAVKRLRAANKTVIAELAGPREKEYMLAAAANKVRLDPATDVVLDGFAITQLYFADTLAKLGVRFDAVAIGRYKTGPDPLVRNEPRPEEREVIDGILQQSFALFTEALGERGISGDTVQRIVQQGLWTPAQALKIGLVDELTQPTEPGALPRLVQQTEPLPPRNYETPRFGPQPIIAVIPIVGNIVSDGTTSLLPGGSAVASTIIEQLDAARQSRDVAAIVLRVDSPGGEVYASELIWRAVRSLAEEKPVVVSMGGVAASGGYYVALPAQVVLAEPDTITGSIGIFAVLPDLSGLLKKIGVHDEVYRKGPHADWDSALRPLSEEERETVRRGLEVHYDAFLKRVASGRKLPLEKVKELAQGRVYTGAQAEKLGLVDAMGSLSDAVAEAKARAGIPASRAVDIRIPKQPFDLSSALIGVAAADATVNMSLVEHAAAALRRLDRRALAILPYRLELQE